MHSFNVAYYCMFPPFLVNAISTSRVMFVWAERELAAGTTCAHSVMVVVLAPGVHWMVGVISVLELAFNKEIFRCAYGVGHSLVK